MSPEINDINSSPEQSTPAPEGVRKLVAILFSDIKDFSKKMQDDEAKTMRMLERHNQMMTDTVVRHGGHIIKTIGDAFLVSFESAVNATECAVEAQQKFHQYNSTIAAHEEPIVVRIGVHVGDVIVKEDDVFGDGVNIASRIQTMTEPGSVNISSTVYDQVKNKLDLRVINLGAPQLKNIRESVHIYQLIILPSGVAPGRVAGQLIVAKARLRRKKTQHFISGSVLAIVLIAGAWIYFRSPAPARSIAVLAFENIGDSTNQYVADGIAEELIERLSQLPQTTVISRSGSFAYKGKLVSERNIAKELGVRYLVTGRVKQIGNELSIVARLLEPEKDKLTWSETYEIARTEILRIESEIPRQVADRLKVEFSPEGGNLVSAAYDLYLRGLFEMHQLKKESNTLAIAYFTQAIEQDSTFARPYHGLGNAQLNNYERGWDVREQWLVSSEMNFRKALSLDSTLSEAYGSLGRVLIDKGDSKGGLEMLEHAVRINPNDESSLAALGNQYNYNLNNPEKAINYYVQAQRVDPRDYHNIDNLGYGYFGAKNYDEAIKMYRKALGINPSFEQTWINLGVVFQRLSLYDSVTVAWQRVLAINPSNEPVREGLAEMYLVLGKFAIAESTLRAGVAMSPLNYRLQYSLAHTLEHEGRPQDAKKMWKDGLQLAQDYVQRNLNLAEPRLYVALFEARLGAAPLAIEAAREAFKLDSLDSDIIYGMSRVYSVINDKQLALEWFRRARASSSEYDETVLKVDPDLDNFRGDPDFLAAARN